MQTTPPLTADQIEEHLDEFVDSVLSSRRTAAQPATKLACFDRATQSELLRQIAIVASCNPELAYQFANHVSAALHRLQMAGVHAWMLRAMDVFDTRGLHTAVAVIHDIDGFAKELQIRRQGLYLNSVQSMLESFLCGLSGRALKIAAHAHPYTDTETVYLPVTIARFSDKKFNFLLYKAQAVHAWAQTWFGTWRGDIDTLLLHHAQPECALAWFYFFECIRLDACIERELPGVFRDMENLLQLTEQRRQIPQDCAHLQKPGSTAHDSLTLVDPRCANNTRPSPPRLCYQGTCFPAQVAQIKHARIHKEKLQLRQLLKKWQNDLQVGSAATPQRQTKPPPFQLRLQPNEQQPELWVDGKPVAPPAELKSLLGSVYQDLGDIPDEYLVPAGAGPYSADLPERDPRDVWKGPYHEEGAFTYNEWDYERNHYRKNWAVLRELDVHPHWDDFVSQTKAKYKGQIKQLRRTFEALRGEHKTLKKQPFGEDIDIDALVEAHCDTLSGMEMSERVFSKMHKIERNIAVMFMVDMSGSTKGWINDAEREALVLLCEALESLGDRYAIYGFSSLTHKRCEVFRVKRFDEAYSQKVQARISGIVPQDYTRMGVAIRHLCSLLNKIEARTKILITLSDGKPDDYDAYRGQYGIEDTRKALIEAKRDRIHPFCITIDTEAKAYLAHMYGAVNFTVIDQIHKLPLKISEIYRKLTV